MPIDAAEVRRVAELAKLDLDRNSLEMFRHQLGSILDYVAMLDEVDVSRVPTTATTVESNRPLREDSPRVCLSIEEALANAPDGSDGQFRVPGIIKG